MPLIAAQMTNITTRTQVRDAPTIERQSAEFMSIYGPKAIEMAMQNHCLMITRLICKIRGSILQKKLTSMYPVG